MVNGETPRAAFSIRRSAFCLLHSGLIATLLLTGLPARSATVTLLHFSDYHSQALPFDGRGGIARAIGYLSRHKQQGALVFSGGDMINRGAPAWSDRHGCVEWPWLNGIVDAMAFGNHDADYGYAAFARCRDALDYPILSANTAGFPPYVVLEASGVRIGVFAVAGADFSTLVRVPELRFGDPLAAARETVRTLREKERVAAVVLIGHQSAADDYELARTVEGIDVIFGSHSHLEKEPMQIPGTRTWFISGHQYLTHISRVDLTFDGKTLTSVSGELVPVDAEIAPDPAVRARVASLQRELERDPQYSALFVPFTTLPHALPIEVLARTTLEIMREAAGADVALSTASSFRRGLPAGPIHPELLRGALPYDNEIVVAQLPAARARELLAFARSRDGDAFGWSSGAASDGIVTVATTDYLAKVAAGYRDFFRGVDVVGTGLRVRAELKKHLERRHETPAHLDRGRAPVMMSRGRGSSGGFHSER